MYIFHALLLFELAFYKFSFWSSDSSLFIYFIIAFYIFFILFQCKYMLWIYIYISIVIIIIIFVDRNQLIQWFNLYYRQLSIITTLHFISKIWNFQLFILLAEKIRGKQYQK